MQNEIRGKVLEVGKLKTYEKFKVRSVVIETLERYAQYFKVDFANEHTDKLDGIKVGDDITITCFLSGRKWANPQTGAASYFTSLRGTGLSVHGTYVSAESAPRPAEAPAAMAEATASTESLPF